MAFPEFLRERDGIIPVKEAVSGTTLADNGPSSYIARMKVLDRGIKADAFVCQLSTNDASKNVPLGELSPGRELKNFDTSTVAGAIEYITVYAEQTFRCPVMFYTGTRYDSGRYGEMVALLNEIAAKYGIHVLDMWNDEELNGISAEEYERFMADGIHPRLEGYREWWLPQFEKALAEIL